MHILYRMVELVVNKSETAPGVLGLSIISILCIFSLELLWHTLVEMELSATAIIFRKPWKHYGFFRRSRNSWTITVEAWDELHIFTSKSRYLLYFRKGRSAVFFATIESGDKMVAAIREQYPEKKYFWNASERPSELRKRMKKEYPERVMKG